MMKIGDNPKNRGIILLLTRFLKEKQVYYLYMKYMENYSNVTASTIPIHLNTLTDNRCYISYFFFWSETKEGEQFWGEVSKSWLISLQIYKNEKTNR